jgi:hypothetical protein
MGAKVLIIGRKRPAIRAILPYFSKNFSVMYIYFFLKNKESSFLNNCDPITLPKPYPTKFPNIPAAANPNNKVTIGVAKIPRLANNPAVNNKESPGKKNPKNNPVSAKIIINRMEKPPVRTRYSGSKISLKDSHISTIYNKDLLSDAYSGKVNVKLNTTSKQTHY